jgi:membrane dipeptidase
MIGLTPEQEQRAARIHAEAIVIDQHSDIQMDVVAHRGKGMTRVLAGRHLPGLRQGGFTGLVLGTLGRFGLQLYPYLQTPTHAALQMIDSIYQEVEETPDALMIATRAEDFRRAKREGKLAFAFGMEGVEPVGQDLSMLRTFYRLGLRVAQPTWHNRNLAADGCGEAHPGGLSNFGRELIKEMNRVGILIDLAHLAEPGFWDVVELSSRPVMVSHGNCKAICNHVRNLTDDQIRAIGAMGGIVGAVFLEAFVREQAATVEHVLDHIDHMVKLIGVDHVGLGPDYIDYNPGMIIASLDVAGVARRRLETTIPYATGAETAAELPNVTRGLVARGYADDDIKKVLGGNFLRLFEQVCG